MRQAGDEHAPAATTFWGAMRTIIIADAVMGLDNVLAVAGAAHRSYLLVGLGLAISVPIVVWGSTLVLKLVDRFPAITYLGAGVLEHQGKIVRVGDGIYYTPHSWEQLTARTLAFIDDHGSITLAQFRDHFGTSRKYAQAALEQMDLLRYTRRIGDDRVRGPKRPGPRSTESPDGEGSVGDRDISGAIAD